MRRGIGAVVLLTAAMLGLSSCGGLPSLDMLPAPAPVSGKTYRIDAVFADALNLGVGAKVKQDGVVIGDVTDISTHDYTARVRMRISQRIRLPVGTTAQVRFTSPLGEDYIALSAPAKPSTAVLADRAVLAETNTSAAPTIEDTFAALSLLLNGGGLNQLGTIVGELNRALGGHTGAARDTIAQLDTVARSLDAHKADLDHILTSLAQLSTELAGQRSVIGQTLDAFPPAVQVVADQMSRLDDLVRRVGELGTRTQSVIARGQQALLTDLDELRPSLDALVGAQGSFPSTMQSLIRFGTLIDRATPGDYLNTTATINVLFGTEPAPLPSAPATGPGAIAALLSGGIR
ncbi:MAG: phospholipid/cholesterol/gamma-HCH transport system substrate-binding protein [Pseudonocardiales bacterium]|nr:phospholipid/cholesterol/gamma-HCH transport system substrate-binding protein [Pseudonocardiales bacterium]